jgi:hypothetical protein
MSIPPTPGSPLGAVNVRRPSSLWKIYLILCFSYFPQNLPGVYETVRTCDLTFIHAVPGRFNFVFDFGAVLVL